MHAWKGKVDAHSKPNSLQFVPLIMISAETSQPVHEPRMSLRIEFGLSICLHWWRYLPNGTKSTHGSLRDWKCKSQLEFTDFSLQLDSLHRDIFDHWLEKRHKTCLTPTFPYYTKFVFLCHSSSALQMWIRLQRSIWLILLWFVSRCLTFLSFFLLFSCIRIRCDNGDSCRIDVLLIELSIKRNVLSTLTFSFHACWGPAWPRHPKKQAWR